MVYTLFAVFMLFSFMQPSSVVGPALRAVKEYEPAITVATLDSETRGRISGASWKPGCPAPIEDLRIVRVVYADFDRHVKEGELICHYLVADEIADIFLEMYDAGFPIERVRLVDDYGADDLLSMEDNNTSAFNFRVVSGSSSLSKHAYGLAIDINPVQNPYVEGGGSYVSPDAGRGYLDRGDIRPGMITRGDAVYEAFVSRGWVWGGDWRYQIDYQHFQKDVDIE